MKLVVEARQVFTCLAFFVANFVLPAKIAIYLWAKEQNTGKVQMKLKVIVIILSGLILWSGSGCQGPWKRLPDGKAALPPDIAGTWKAQNSPWKIVLAPDGTVTSAVIPMGEVEVRPHKTTKVEMQDGSYSTYKAGDCIVEYTPDTRELFVSVEVKEIRLRYLQNALEGNSIERLVGPVSEDGKVWTADWITIFDYGPRFPQDANDIIAEPLIFEKVEN